MLKRIVQSAQLKLELATDRAKLKMDLYADQKLYAQMVKDRIEGTAKDEVADRIRELTLKLYRNLTPNPNGKI